METNPQRSTFMRVLALPFLLLIRAYRLVSPLKQLILGPYARCRFHPTCSEYALECFQRFNPIKASWMSFNRIGRCNPLHAGGYDPVTPSVTGKGPHENGSQ